MANVVLIDADILCYQIASSLEDVIVFGDRHVLHADAKQGREELVNAIEYIIDTVDADEAILALTHPFNFRTEVLKSYKGNRTGTRKPMILPDLREYCLQIGALMYHGLEGDDILGIMASDPDATDNRIIYSADKDLKTIPGLIWNADDGQIEETSEGEADYNFLFQTLTGDPTDNYKGCPRVGAVKAKAILDKETSWEAVVNAYEKAGLTERDALQQARCARILRHGEYDFEKERVNIWTPK
jgi:DNA polymerase-1